MTLDLQWLHAVAKNVVRTMHVHPAAGLDVDDLVQIGALAAIERQGGYRDPNGGATLKTWLWRHADWAMRSEVMKCVRRHKLAPMLSVPDGFEVVDEDALRAACAMERAEAAVAVVAGMDERDRQLVRLVYADDLDLSDVALLRGVTKGAVSRAHSKVIARLRERLASHA